MATSRVTSVAPGASAVPPAWAAWAEIALRGPTILWDGRCPFCHQAAAYHFLHLNDRLSETKISTADDSDAGTRSCHYLFVQHPFTLWLLEYLGISYKDATYRIILLENNRVHRAALAAARAMQLMEKSYVFSRVLGVLGASSFVPRSERSLHYEKVSENRKYGTGAKGYWAVRLLSWAMEKKIVKTAERRGAVDENRLVAGDAASVAFKQGLQEMFLHGDVEVRAEEVSGGAGGAAGSYSFYWYAELMNDAGPDGSNVAAGEDDGAAETPRTGGVGEADPDGPDDLAEAENGDHHSEKKTDAGKDDDDDDAHSLSDTDGDEHDADEESLLAPEKGAAKGALDAGGSTASKGDDLAARQVAGKGVKVLETKATSSAAARASQSQSGTKAGSPSVAPLSSQFSFLQYREAFSSAVCVQSFPFVLAGVVGYLLLEFFHTLTSAYPPDKQGPAFSNSLFTELRWTIAHCWRGFLNSKLFGGHSPPLHELARWSMFLLVMSYVVVLGGLCSGAWGAFAGGRSAGVDDMPADNSELLEAGVPAGGKKKAAPSTSYSRFMDTGFEDKYTFEIVRRLMVWLMGVVYFAGFLTSIFQHRAIFGAFGLQPVWGSRVGTPLLGSGPEARHGPTPLFSLLGYGDLQLEFVSLTGLFAALFLIFSPAMSEASASRSGKISRGETTGFDPHPSQSYMFWPSLYCYLGYLSIVNMSAGMVSHYGWEWEVCSMGFLLLFLVSPPLELMRTLKLRRAGSKASAEREPADGRVTLPRQTQRENENQEPAPGDEKADATRPDYVSFLMGPPTLIVFLMRYMAFKFLLGAGMSKVHGSACWRDYSCTATHYHTQGLPTPLSYYFERLPDFAHELEGRITFFEQLVLPVFFLLPLRSTRIAAGLLELFFQLMLVLTGSYAVVNYVALVPALALFDDQFLADTAVLLGGRKMVGGAAAEVGAGNGGTMTEENGGGIKEQPGGGQPGEEEEQLRGICSTGPAAANYPFFRNPRRHQRALPTFGILHKLCAWIVFLVFVTLSGNVVKELLGPRPWIQEFDSLYLMNAHGLFGWINRHRVQLVLEYSHSSDAGEADAGHGVLPDGQGQQGAGAPSFLELQEVTSFLELGGARKTSFDHRDEGDLGYYEGDGGRGEAVAGREGPRLRGENSPASLVQVVPEVEKNAPKKAEPGDGGGNWKPLEFIGLPSRVDRRPRFIAPYHLRLDWQVWIDTTCGGEDSAANREFSDPAKIPTVMPVAPGTVPEYLMTLLAKIQRGDRNAARLLGTPEEDLFPNGKPPSAFRASYYEYEFDYGDSGNWWKRKLIDGGEPRTLAVSGSLSSAGSTPPSEGKGAASASFFEHQTGAGAELAEVQAGEEKTGAKAQQLSYEGGSSRVPLMVGLTVVTYLTFWFTSTRYARKLLPGKRRKRLLALVPALLGGTALAVLASDYT
eukprot:g2262.t1